MSNEKSVCTKCGHVGYPDTIPTEKKNPAIGMTIGAFVLMGICLLVGYGSGQSKDWGAGCSGILGSGCLAGIFLITGIVCLVIAIGKASSNARKSDEEVCPGCKAPGMIPAGSPVAQKFLADHNITL